MAISPSRGNSSQASVVTGQLVRYCTWLPAPPLPYASTTFTSAWAMRSRKARCRRANSASEKRGYSCSTATGLSFWQWLYGPQANALARARRFARSAQNTGHRSAGASHGPRSGREEADAAAGQGPQRRRRGIRHQPQPGVLSRVAVVAAVLAVMGEEQHRLVAGIERHGRRILIEVPEQQRQLLRGREAREHARVPTRHVHALPG